ncbi:MAG: M4 family metallopeptidase [Saprospiraceae bacterium]|nr:M4 family metallopeptidase [Saprospiraceae bacterium]
MNKIYFLTLVVLFGLITNVQAQWEKKERRGTVDLNSVTIKPQFNPELLANTQARTFEGKISYRPISAVALRLEDGIKTKVLLRTNEGSIWVDGEMESGTARDYTKSTERNLLVQHALAKCGLDAALEVKEIEASKTGDEQHYKLQQLYKEIPVWTNQLTLHLKGSKFQVLGHLNSMPFEDKAVVTQVDDAEALAVKKLQSEGINVLDIEKKKELNFLLQDDAKELVWYPKEGKFTLAWHLSYHPNLSSRWEYFIDAHDGSIIDDYESLCKAHHLPPDFFDGKSVGTGLDLNGDVQNIQTYQIGNVHTLIDVTRTDMFDSRGAIPGNPIGVIVTLDAMNTYPGGQNFNYQDLVSNSTTWNNPDAISAHVNAAKAYEYFRQVFNRISINGQGGNIISLINVADENGQKMDNAFWNGKAIFYGEGNQAFSSPLARGLDVAAHELGHGVIETTANLLYQGESGALNESFADVFGVLVENEDWLIGEDIVNKSIFPVALRNMADPHNGGSSLNDNGWQPAHYSERYTGRQDNGGVHINSGITNRAFYLFATDDAVGVEQAEQVYYSVLTNYLTRSSQFVDMRASVIAASRSLYGESVAQAAASAFDAVGIAGGQTGSYIEDVEVNPGQDLIVVVSFDDGLLHLIDAEGNALKPGPLSNIPPRNPPSVTDDGSLILFVGEDGIIHYISLDRTNLDTEEGMLEPNPIWANVAISKDGTKAAAVLDAKTDSLYVFSLLQQTYTTYELYNPTTANGDITTAEVQFADGLEWDHTGEFVLYDAFNSLTKLASEESFDYWDINFIHAWDAESDTYGDGEIVKLFSGLPEQISIANPTFSKNSPYIIAFDYLDESIAPDALSILGLNLETYDVGTIFDNTTTPGYPSFSRTDDKIIFDAKGETSTDVIDVLGIINLADDKINGSGDASIFYQNAVWGEWFSNGERTLVSILEGDREDGELTLYPNPASSRMYLQADWLEKPQDLRIDIISLDGKVIKETRNKGGQNDLEIDISNLTPGTYFMKLRSPSIHRVYQFVKQ